VRYFSALLIAGLACFLTYAQEKRTLPLSFELVYGTHALHPDDDGVLLHEGDSLSIETFRFYISAIELYSGNELQWKEPASYHLVDASVPSSQKMSLSIPSKIVFNSIRFRLGIDSATNVSGVMGGDLDPSKGMYWTWQSGYINFKLEGKNKRCATRHNEFQFHLGGYMSPHASSQEVTLSTGATSSLNIVADIAQFLSGIDIARQNSIMIPGADAVTLSRRAASMFSIRP